MNAAKYIRYILTIATALLFFSACKDDKNESQPTDFILRVDESVSIKLPNSTSYTITTNNSAISYELSVKILTVTAIKEGKATLTVILDSGESHNYSFTISANSYQMGFTIDSTPRIESWISGSTVKTEETAGLQVSCEPGMDITGSPTDKSVRSYGFTYVETGKLLRFSAQGDFSQKGILNNGIMATLADPAGDGMPLLLTVDFQFTGNLTDTLKVWTWNGISAMPYDFEDDTELGWTFGYDFGTYDGNEAALRVGDGLGIAIGEAGGSLYSAVLRGQLELIRPTMPYPADAWNGTTATGTLLPLVNATGKIYDQKAPVSALVNAGWTKVDGYNAYQLVSVDGLYQFFDTYAAQDSWLAADNARFTASKSQLIEVTTGESYLLGHWTDGALMRAALAAYAQKAATNNGDFFDVPTSHWAYDTVKWAVDRGITNGTSATSFSPNSTCTKAQILTFLWRAKGEPAAGNTNPFQDVPLSAYYYQPALWARNQGLVNGTLFQPNSPCTRAQTVYYLWQLAGSPNVSGTTNFQDVPGNATYAKAVQWAVQQKITDGTSFTTFSPLDTCTRAQIVTFLYRALK